MEIFATARPSLVLAPMQAVTDLPFMRIVARRGAPDWFVTEYFRVYPNAQLDPYILRSITENQTGKPIFAQLIGNDEPALRDFVLKLLVHPIAGIDLNLGCPAPIVCRKDAGGGLLRNLEKIDRLLGTLREVIPIRFTVKTRVGYHSPDEFVALLEIFKKHAIDLLTIHARTVEERYQTPIHPELVALAKQQLSCPIIANGNIVNVETGLAYHAKTLADGLMIGRGAIRNPWIFSQLQSAFAKQAIFQPSHRDVLGYIEELYEEVASETRNFDALKHVQRMKRYLVYITQGLSDEINHSIRRAQTPEEFHSICRELNSPEPFPCSPPANSKIFCGFSDLLTP